MAHPNTPGWSRHAKRQPCFPGWNDAARMRTHAGVPPGCRTGTGVPAEQACCLRHGNVLRRTPRRTRPASFGRAYNRTASHKELPVEACVSDRFCMQLFIGIHAEPLAARSVPGVAAWFCRAFTMVEHRRVSAEASIASLSSSAPGFCCRGRWRFSSVAGSGLPRRIAPRRSCPCPPFPTVHPHGGRKPGQIGRSRLVPPSYNRTAPSCKKAPPHIHPNMSPTGYWRR